MAQSERAGIAGWQLNELKAVIVEDRLDVAWREKKLDEALKYARESVKLHETFSTLSSVSRLLVETGKCEEAFPYIDKALEYYPSHAPLISYKGYALTKLGRYDAGYREYLRAADLGFVWAQRTVATALLSGRGVKQDRAQAIAWLQRAAAKGDPQAMDELAQLAKGGQISGPPPLAPWSAK